MRDNTQNLTNGQMPMRNYGLDLYKILCMFFVIAFHFSDHGNTIVSCSQDVTFSWCILAFSRVFGAICNCAFMLISGYFLYQKKFNIRNIFKLWSQVWFYSVVIGIVCYVIGTEPISIRSVIAMVFPFLFNQYWFFSTYIVVYLFFPYLNKLINSLTRKQHQGIIVIGIMIFSLLYTLTDASWIVGSNSIAIFFVLYFVGAYINKYEICISKRIIILLSFFFMVVEFASVFFMRIVYRYTGFDSFAYLVWGTEKILPIFTSIVLFFLFKQVQIKHIKLVSFFSASVFGVYLFHIGRLNIYLFKGLFDNSITYNTHMLLPQIIIAMCSIFIAGIIFDKIRIYIFEIPIIKLLDLPLEKINKRIQRYYPD